MALNFNNIMINEEFEKLLPPLSKEDFDILEQSLLKNGFDQKFGRIKVWFGDEGNIDNKSDGCIIDGHNRYRICQKYKIELNSWDYEAVFMDSKEEVIKWIFENQLARRNLSQTEKYEIVERYSIFLNEMAKKNQSDGGKGLSNLTKVNVRQEKAKRAGMSDGNYYKLDKVMKSNNEEVKQKLKDKKISIDKAYKMVREPKKDTPLTQTKKIEQLDNRMNEIDKEISSLRTEREVLMRKRSHLFSESEIECKLKYEFVDNDNLGVSRDCVFYIEFEGNKDILANVSVYLNESPLGDWQFIMNKIPEKYKNDFIMLWKKAHDEEVEYCNRKFAEFESRKSVSMDLKVGKEFHKKCFRILAKSFHPDNGEGNIEDMQLLNQLKQTWGV